jgi:hypothetical protein
MAQVTGRVFITVGGKRLASKEGATLKFGDVKREPVLADSGVVGYSESLTAPEVDCTISHTGETSLKELQGITDATLSFDTDSGRSYVLRNAWCAGALELSKGEVKLNFSGIKCEEA